ncbi:ATP-binding cassette domain-containing protein [Cohnella endophytica]|uniref:ATP-binding cassette domain-containing protein n=2 Tax=Cohnella endophytica TaxID=2419778 RepID=A0A494XTT8_9BACL|nr:ATP-binding cassette domain-containing protein [Cohnella endophytica]
MGAFKDFVAPRYEQKDAVNEVSFSIDKGEIVGYIGPNGAGKSTTIKMMVGILVPTSGTVTIGGLVPFENRLENSRRIGVVFGQRTQLWWDIPVIETYKLMQYIYKIPKVRFEHNIRQFADILGIDEFVNTPVRQLSLGQRMRADLCAALLHDPEIIYLDEPTIGLDVDVKERVRGFIKEVNRSRETTVILTTHDTSDLDKLCSRVMVIDQGTLMYDGDLDYLKKNYSGHDILTVETENELPDGLLAGRFGDAFTREGRKCHVRVSPETDSSAECIAWFLGSATVKDIQIRQTEIDEVIRNLYGSFKETERGS